MELDDRKVMILNAVIKNYMETGEPVGSRTRRGVSPPIRGIASMSTRFCGKPRMRSKP